MMSLKVTFPTHEDRICHASIHITKTNNLMNKDKYCTQVSSKYVLVKLINCFENNEPIEIGIDQIRRSVKEVRMTELENKYYHRVDTSLITSPKLDTSLLFELDNRDSRNRITFKLSE
ncbi:unnamed protein product [Brachionus calyciflorus]|uniref:Uncharacterized protein n=1 Tax=Brachionus calyciflorus TaxID=104777 RepID=A0A813RG59_9BILA|nr:unnamed protein product [Brachionus calyciflorus]